MTVAVGCCGRIAGLLMDATQQARVQRKQWWCSMLFVRSKEGRGQQGPITPAGAAGRDKRPCSNQAAKGNREGGRIRFHGVNCGALPAQSASTSVQAAKASHRLTCNHSNNMYIEHSRPSKHRPWRQHNGNRINRSSLTLVWAALAAVGARAAAPPPVHQPRNAQAQHRRDCRQAHQPGARQLPAKVGRRACSGSSRTDGM